MTERRPVCVKCAKVTEAKRYCSNACRQRAYRQRSQGRAPETAIPVPLDVFVGRRREYAQLRALVKRQRLVTVVGGPGIGKTRLAVEVAAKWPQHGAWLADLATATDAAEAIAEALGSGTSGLLVVDTCEHVVERCAVVVGRLLARHPNLRVLATSRQQLGLRGEVVYRLGRLPVESDAVRLFVDRAQLVVPGLELDDTTAPLIAELCARLDGEPLAVELAARCLTTSSLPDLVAGLDHRLDLLSGGFRTAHPRHRSLRAAIEWSYALLTTEQQSAYRRLALLPGRVDIEQRVLEALADRSLIRAEVDVFVVPQSVRLHAWELLRARGEALGAIPPIARALDEAERRQATLALLDEAQVKIIRLLVDGLSNRQIATRLAMSTRAVALRIGEIKSLLLLRSRTQVAAWGARSLQT